jgi:hypothetical protein
MKLSATVAFVFASSVAIVHAQNLGDIPFCAVRTLLFRSAFYHNVFLCRYDPRNAKGTNAIP